MSNWFIVVMILLALAGGWLAVKDTRPKKNSTKGSFFVEAVLFVAALVEGMILFLTGHRVECVVAWHHLKRKFHDWLWKRPYKVIPNEVVKRPPSRHGPTCFIDAETGGEYEPSLWWSQLSDEDRQAVLQSERRFAEVSLAVIGIVAYIAWVVWGNPVWAG